MFVKICGITNTEDATLAVDAGADAIGVNLVRSSPRYVDELTAREIARAVAGQIEVVGVVANLSIDEMQRLRADLGIRDLQLHGDESQGTLAAILPAAYKAVRVSAAEDAASAASWPGDKLLVDAKVPGALGGTGTTFDWTLVHGLCQMRHVLLAGGLTPENVQEAIDAAGPWGVDVASGVEEARDPRRKDAAKVRAFIARARRAY
jgi:phosphoribosylanthranilate isomerase